MTRCFLADISLSHGGDIASVCAKVKFKSVIGIQFERFSLGICDVIERVMPSVEFYSGRADELPIGAEKWSEVMNPDRNSICLCIDDICRQLRRYKPGEVPMHGWESMQELMDGACMMFTGMKSLTSEKLKHAGNAFFGEIFNIANRGRDRAEWYASVKAKGEKLKRLIEAFWEDCFKFETQQAERPVARKVRSLGVSEFEGVVYEGVEVSGGRWIKVRRRMYAFDGCEAWRITDRFLRSLRNGDDHSAGNYPVQLDGKEVNRARGQFKAFLMNCVERERMKGRGNRCYSGRARFVYPS